MLFNPFHIFFHFLLSTMITDFDFVVQIAAKKNHAMAANPRRGLLETVLQRQMWQSLRDHFALSQKTPTIPEPVISEEDAPQWITLDDSSYEQEDAEEKQPQPEPKKESISISFAASSSSSSTTPFSADMSVSQQSHTASPAQPLSVKTTTTHNVHEVTSDTMVVASLEVGVKRHLQVDDDAPHDTAHPSPPKRLASYEEKENDDHHSGFQSMDVCDVFYTTNESVVAAGAVPAAAHQPAETCSLSACHSLFRGRTITGIPFNELMSSQELMCS